MKKAKSRLQQEKRNKNKNNKKNLQLKVEGFLLVYKKILEKLLTFIEENDKKLENFYKCACENDEKGI